MQVWSHGRPDGGAATTALASDGEAYQDRLARCLASYAWIVATLAIVVAIPYFAFPDVRERILPLPALVALARVPILALAVAGLRMWRLDERVLVVTEVVLTIIVMTLGSVPLAVGTRDLALDLSAVPWLLVLLALRVGLLRASTRRELLVSTTAALPLMGAAAVRAMHDDSLDLHHPGWVAIVVVALWSAAGIAVATFSTRAFGRLRSAVEQARQLGPYTIEAKVGQGGMGAVYRAHHALLRRPAAIKLLRPRATGEMDFERFELEAQHTSRLSHPNIVSIFDYGRTPDGGFYYVMEYLDGYNLQELVVHHGPLPVPRALHVLIQVCRGLAEAHGLGLVHRDIKPANIILTTRLTEPDVAKVVDFGLVHSGEHRRPREGSVVGTLGYMAPEALRGRGVDARADLYGLGALAYFVLAGREVFSGDDRELVHRHLLEAPLPPSSVVGAIPAALDAVILRCLQKEPEARFASAIEVSAALEEIARSYPYDPREGRDWWRAHAIKKQPLDRQGAASALPYLETVPIDLRRRAGESRSTQADSPQGLRGITRS